MSRGHLSWRRQREGVKRAHIAANRGFSQGPAGPAVSLITGRLFDCEARPSRPAKWPMPKAQTAHVFARLAEMRAAVGTDPAEERVWQTLRCSGMKWKRCRMWGSRIFLFWCERKGIAIEFDGPACDRDEWQQDNDNYRNSGIVVVRVMPDDEAMLAEAVRWSKAACSWRDRRIELGLHVYAKKTRRRKPVEVGKPANDGNPMPF